MSDIVVDRMGRVIAAAFAGRMGPRVDNEMTQNAFTVGSQFYSSLLDPRRDVNKECHYPETSEVSPEDYKALFDRDPLANRVTSCICKESWQVQPQVYEAEDPDVTTPFEEAWDALQPMTTGASWYRQESGGSVWDYLLRADILSGIGHFGVLLMGFDDGKNLQEPVDGAMTTNAFCPTGEGGGQDNSCSREYLLPWKENDIKKASVEEGGDYREYDLPNNGVLQVAYYPEESRISVLWLGDKKGGENLSNKVGPANLRLIYQHLKSDFPGATLISGIRVGGSAKGNIRRVVHTFNRDCYLTEREEAVLRNLPDLSDQETHTLNQLADQRRVVVNYMQEQQDKQRLRDGNGNGRGRSLFGDSTGEQQTGDGLEGTDKQYSQGFGLRGEADYEPGPAGTDQQYFGVQFGPTQMPSKQASPRKTRLLFLRPFDESLVQVVRYEWNINNPRFGMPVMYRITLNDPREQHSGIGLPMATVFVHWSRVIHLADNLNSSEIFGAPRMRAVLNRLLDLQKIYGASGEGYWQAAFTGIALSTHPQLGGDVEIDMDDLRDQMENYINSFQRYLAMAGMSATTIAPAVNDPTGHITAHIEAICIQLGMPVRILKGSERGELASSQDDASWNDRLRARQMGYITPRIICPFVDRLIQVGVLPEPSYVEPEEPETDELGWPTGQTDDQFPWEEQPQYDESGQSTEPQEEDERGIEDEESGGPRQGEGQAEEEEQQYGEDGEPIEGDDEARDAEPDTEEGLAEGPGDEDDDGEGGDEEIEEDDQKEDDRSPRSLLKNAFCSTGKGGGVDPSCSGGGSTVGSGGKTAWSPGEGKHTVISKSPDAPIKAAIAAARKVAGDLDIRVKKYNSGSYQVTTINFESRGGGFNQVAIWRSSSGLGSDREYEYTFQQHDISLPESERGKGIGGKMIEGSVAVFKAVGVSDIPIHVNTNRPFWDKIAKKHKGVYAENVRSPRSLIKNVARGRPRRRSIRFPMLLRPKNGGRIYRVIYNAELGAVEAEQVGTRSPVGYSVAWPDLDSNTDKDKAQIAATKTQALATYVSGNVESVMPLMEFYTKVLGMDDEEAKPLVKAAEAQQAEMQQQQMEQQMMGGGVGQEGQPGMEGEDGQFGQGGEDQLPLDEGSDESDDEEPWIE